VAIEGAGAVALAGEEFQAVVDGQNRRLGAWGARLGVSFQVPDVGEFAEVVGFPEVEDFAGGGEAFPGAVKVSAALEVAMGEDDDEFEAVGGLGLRVEGEEFGVHKMGCTRKGHMRTY
jgi:hypothetical protein